jgi:glutamyl/glutaminyl-tRNA synthetase
LERFTLDGISRSPAIYDMEKMSWMNGHYLAQAAPERIAGLLLQDAEKKGYLGSTEQLIPVIELLKTRVRTVPAILEEGAYFFEAPAEYNEKGSRKYFGQEDSLKLLEECLSLCQASDFESAEKLEQELRQRASDLKLKAANLIHPIRLAISGRTATPGLFEVMMILGKSECIERISKAILYVKSL